MATISRDAVSRFFDKGATTERRLFRYTGPASYATGGDSLTPESIALSKIDTILGMTITNGTAIRLGVWDPTNKKIWWYLPNTGVEVAAAQDLSGYTGYFEAIGR